jgi:hypothetical protein
VNVFKNSSGIASSLSNPGRMERDWRENKNGTWPEEWKGTGERMKTEHGRKNGKGLEREHKRNMAGIV